MYQFKNKQKKKEYSGSGDLRQVPLHFVSPCDFLSTPLHEVINISYSFQENVISSNLRLV
jgi:hypothetical protein